MSQTEVGAAQSAQTPPEDSLSKRDQLESPHEQHQPPVVAVTPVELRVHGVSGTPPEQMLVSPGISRPAVRQVAGDSTAGFLVQDGPHPPEIEAYSWGGLTSGGKLRALWLLLVPFMLVNLAFYTASAPLGDPYGKRHTASPRRILEAALRLFALSLTAAFVLAFVVASMDIVGWQYVQQAGQAKVQWLSFLTWGWLAHANIQLLVTTLVPLLLVVLLWHLGRSTWQRLESTTPPVAEPAENTPLRPLEDRAMWNGQRPVGHLRALHISFALAMLGLFLVMPLLMDPAKGGFATWSTTWQRPWGWAAILISAALAACGVIAVMATCLPSMSDRTASDRPKAAAPDEKPTRTWAILRTVVIAVFGAAAALLAFPGPWQAVWPSSTVGSLPGSVVSVQILFVAQGVLAIAVFFFAWRLRVHSDRDTSADQAAVMAGAGDGADAEAVMVAAAWLGLAPGLLTVIAWLLGGGLAAALSLFVARVIGTPVSSATTPGPLSPDSVVVPAPFIWAAAAIVPVVVCAVIIAVVTYVFRINGGSAEQLPAVEEAFERPPGANPQFYEQRVQSIAKTWAIRQRLIDQSVTPVGVFVLATGLIVLTGSVLYLLDPAWITRYAGWLVGVGVVLMAALMAWLLLMVRKVFQDPGTRRQVGIIWDLGTFWPRAVHPLAPPCYAERAIPDLISRIEFHTGTSAPPADLRPAATGAAPAEHHGGAHRRPVVLSCHSQGSVIGAATVLQLSYEGSDSVALLTYGNPVRRLYSRFFPAYFGLDTVTRIGALLGQEPPAGSEVRQATSEDGHGERADWRWRNLYRPTDPIGGPIFVRRAPGRMPDDVDWNLRDPAGAVPLAGDTCCPPALGHSDYFLDDEFAQADEVLAKKLGRHWATRARSANFG